jgi:hypothetical protein
MQGRSNPGHCWKSWPKGANQVWLLAGEQPEALI